MTTTKQRSAADYSVGYSNSHQTQYATNWNNENFQAAYLQELEKEDPQAAELLDGKKSMLDFTNDEKRTASDALVTSFNKMDFDGDKDRRDCAWNVADAFYQETMKEIHVDEAVKFFNLDPSLADKLKTEGITRLSYQAEIDMPDGTRIANDNPTDFLYETKDQASANRLLKHSPSFTSADHFEKMRADFAEALYESNNDAGKASEDLYHLWESHTKSNKMSLPEAEDIDYKWMSDANRSDHDKEEGLKKILDFYTSEGQERAESFTLSEKDDILEEYLSYARTVSERKLRNLLDSKTMTEPEKDKAYEDVILDLADFELRVKDYVTKDAPLVDNSNFADESEYHFLTTDKTSFATAEEAHDTAKEIVESFLEAYEKVDANSAISDYSYQPAMLLAQELKATLDDAEQQFAGTFGTPAEAGYPKSEVEKALTSVLKMSGGMFNHDGTKRSRTDPYP